MRIVSNILIFLLKLFKKWCILYLVKRMNTIKLTSNSFFKSGGPEILHEIYRKNADPHCHEFYEIELIDSGSGVCCMNGTSFKIDRGSVSILTPADVHEFKNDEVLEITDILLKEEMLSEKVKNYLFEKAYPEHITLSETKLADAHRLIGFLSSVGTYEEDMTSVIRACVECLFDLLLTGESDSSVRPKKLKTAAELAMRYVDLHFRDNPSLSQTAEIVMRSPEYFSRYFKKNTGYYYTEYLNMRKIECAKRLLKAGTMSVTDVCFYCGFTSVSNFIRVFKNMTGKCPADYRADFRRK